MVGAPRNIFKFPSMCATTKPTRTIPVTAITTFLPTIVPHSTTNGWLDQTPRGAAATLVVMELDVLMLLAFCSEPFSCGSIHAQTLSVKGNHFYIACDRIPDD